MKKKKTMFWGAIYVIALISAIDIRLAEKIFATCIVVSGPIIAPAMLIYTYFRRKS